MRKKVKNISALLLSLCVVILDVSFPAFAASAAVSVSIFETVNYRYFIRPLNLTIEEGQTVSDLLDLLVSYAYIDSFESEDGMLTSLTADGQTFDQSEGHWSISINEAESAFAPLSVPLSSGDAVDLTFLSDSPSESESEEEPIPYESALFSSFFDWDSEKTQILRESALWLEESGASDPLALIALGTAGISASYRDITFFLQTLSEETDGEALAKGALACGFCGVNATSALDTDLISVLSEYPDLSREATAWFLIAADSNQYVIPETSLNSRDNMINYLLAAKNEDGGFSTQKGEDSDPFFTSIVAIAFAPYIHDPAVNEATMDALTYLASLPYDGDSFVEYCASICAFASNSRHLPDDMIDGDAMVNRVLDFQTENGAFSSHMDTASDRESTIWAIFVLAAARSEESPFTLSATIDGDATIPLPPKTDPSTEGTASYPSNPNHKTPSPWLWIPVLLLSGGLIYVAMRWARTK